MTGRTVLVALAAFVLYFLGFYVGYRAGKHDADGWYRYAQTCSTEEPR
jgi:hypothetical protein